MAKRPPHAEPNPASGGQKALIVDDNKFIVSLLKRYLEKLGFDAPLTAHDGTEALDLLESAEADVVLCDLHMPGMDGIEFLRHLAARTRPPAVALVSGQDRSLLNTAVQLGRAHGLQVLGSLTKPFRLPELKTLLEQLGGDRAGFTGISFQPLTPEAVRRGLEADAVNLAFQPKVAVRDREVMGVETLLRWRDADGQIKSPTAVVPVAERHGMMNELTRAVIRKALVQHGIWLAAGHDFKLAVNVSQHDLNSYDFPEFVLECAASAGVPPSKVILEVTESQIMADIAKPLEILGRLRLKGVGLAIDDYGTGASTMQQLKRIPFTELKIDREFIAGAPGDPAMRAMLTAVIGLAKDLG
ncbi:MAG TPA: EAL domain-containing response regulator, partial [Kiloniellaceae bacterium]|nr:EAL domain-containing response regulator [Kiloniellaceae bacterium]